MSRDPKPILDAASVIPVLVIDRAADAAPLAKALKAGGLTVVELTLRTAAALDAMKAMKDAEPELIVGMGTLRRPEQVEQSLKAGAQFLVSPGLSPALAHALITSPVPVLPGVATISEAMAAHDLGFTALKFFPAEPAGGIDYLKALRGPLPDLMFCPTGGISRERAPDYLALPNVACVGGSWIASAAQIAGGDWDAITNNARAAAAMKG
jgi:2-dehydro-3-deoxyphosphogluconate aldolase/(4S)-4-hydroxy-2-oxoglutarate aldolase